MTGTRTEQRFTAEEVCDLANVTYRQLNYWTRCGHVEADGRTEVGSGHTHTYTLADAFEVSNMGALIRAGFKLRVAADLVSAHRRPHWETA